MSVINSILSSFNFATIRFPAIVVVDLSLPIVISNDFCDEYDFRRTYNRWWNEGKMFRVKGLSWWPEELPSEEEMQNYTNRTIEPICAAIVNELKRKFLTKTARSQGQSFAVFHDPFRLVPATKIAELADKLTRNEIMTSNEVRQIIGFKPSNDPNADALRNKNINQSSEDGGLLGMGSEENEDYDTSMQELDDIDRQIKDLEDML